MRPTPGSSPLAALAALSALLCAVPSGAQVRPCQPGAAFKLPPDGTWVAQICSKGSAVDSLPTVTIIDPAGVTLPDALKTKQRYADQTTIAVPPSTSVDFVSPVARIRASAGTVIKLGSGAYALAGNGRAQFAVLAHALDFFRVSADRFVAAAPGTVFEVDLTRPESATFSVSDGRIAVTRVAQIALKDQKLVIQGIRVTTYVQAGDPPLTYTRAIDLFATFGSAKQARAAFNADLAAANAAGDRIRADDARSNVAVLNKGSGGHNGFLKNAIRIVAGGLAGYILVKATSPEQAPSPSPTPTPRGG